MTNATFTPSPRNDSITNFKQECVKQECVKQDKKVIKYKYEHGVKNEVIEIEEKLTVKQRAFNMLNALSTNFQLVGRKFKKALTPKKKESIAEKRAKALQFG